MHRAQYRRVADDMRGLITSGAWPPGHRIPSKGLLAETYGVKIGVVTAATALLRSEGLLLGTQRTALWVADPARVATFSGLDVPWPHGYGETRPGRGPADADVAARLGVPPGTVVDWVRTELLDEDGRPSHLRAVYRAGGSAGVVLKDVVGRVRMMTEDEAEHLGLAETWALVVRGVRVDGGGRPVEVAEAVLPWDRWQIPLGG